MAANSQLLMPWGEPHKSDVEAVTAQVPKLGAYCTVKRAAEALGCGTTKVWCMIEEGTLLARTLTLNPDAKRVHKRVIVKAERPYDPSRKKFLSLEEAAKLLTNLQPSQEKTE